MSKKMRTVKTVLLFPHIIVSFVIVALSIIALCISIYFNSQSNNFMSSIFSNIFAGLITGLIICLISGIKQISKTKLKTKKEWLTHITEMYQDYLKFYNDLLNKRFICINDNEEVYDLVYDTAARANWINEYILQSENNNTMMFNSIKYCEDRFDYNAYELIEFFESLHQDIIDFGASNATRKETVERFRAINNKLRKLNSAVHINIHEINDQLSALDNTIV